MPTTSYHRDDLRSELVSAALVHVSAHGHAELSVRKLAQQVKVSSAAPYHHFPDRRSVLEAVADRGFELLRERIAVAARAATGPAERLAAAAHGFLDFSEAYANLFELMYDSELTRPVVEPRLEQQYRRIYLPLLDDFAQLTRSDTEAAVRLRLYWSTLFGFAFLSGRGMRGTLNPADDDEDVLRRRIVLAAIGTGAAGVSE